VGAVVVVPGGRAQEALPTPRQAAAQPSSVSGSEARHLDRYGDPLPPGARARLGTLRLRHRGMSTYAVAYSPDGRVVASAGAPGGGLSLWDAATGKLLRELGPVWHVFALAFSPDSRRLATGDGGRNLRLWDVASGKVIWRADDSVMAVAFSPDGRTLAAGGEERVRLCDAATGRELRQLGGFPGLVRSVAFSPDGRLLAGAGMGKDIHVWDASTGESRAVLAGEGRPGTLWVAFTRAGGDAPLLASAGEDRQVRLWDVVAGRLVETLGECPAAAGALACSPDGKTLATGHSDGTIRLWDVPSRKEVRRLQAYPPAKSVQALAFSPDGRTLASGTYADGAVRLWDAQTGRPRRDFTGPSGGVDWLAFSDRGRSVVMTSHDQTLRRWDWGRDAEEVLFAWQAAPGFVAAALTPDGPAVAWHDLRTRLLWGRGSVKDRDARKITQSPDGVATLALSPDGRRLLTGAYGGVIRLWDVATGAELRTVRGLGQAPSALAFAPDGRTFVSGPERSGQGGLTLWDATTGKDLLSFRCPGGMYRAAFSPDGRLLTCLAGPAGNVQPHVWELATGAEFALPRAVENCSAVGIAGDDRLLAVGECGPPGAVPQPASCAVVMVDLTTGKEVRRFPGQQGAVTAVAFAADGRALASGGTDSTVLVWEVAVPWPAGAVDLEVCWADLTSEDPARAYAAVGRLAAAPGTGVAWLRGRLHRVALLDEAGRRRLQRLLAELDGEDFTTRQRAAEELEKLGEVAAPALRAALGDRPTPEARRHIERLLAGLSAWTAQRLRVSRAVAVLEQAGTPEARRLLEDLAGGAPDALPTREAKAALGRMVHGAPRP
jgi:WD40 repeat protein